MTVNRLIKINVLIGLKITGKITLQNCITFQKNYITDCDARKCNFIISILTIKTLIMGTLNNGNTGKTNQSHDGQKNYQNSNQRNPDNIRNNTRDHEYKEYDEKLTNDENFEDGEIKGEADFDDTKQNADKNSSSE